MNLGDQPAFPYSGGIRNFAVLEKWETGMTLRQYYAGLAMQALISKLPLTGTSLTKEAGLGEQIDEKKMRIVLEGVANGAVIYADTLLAVLEK